MNLKIKRSQRTAGLMGGKLFFALDAQLELTEDERSLIDRYKLGKISVYDSETRKSHQAAAEANLMVNEVTRSWSSYGRAIMSTAMARLSLRVSIDSLKDGQHIECKDLDELLGAEAAIRDACANIRSYLDIAATFDGREEVVAY